MCGIAALIGEDRGRIERMTTALRHRGPDGQGIHVGGGVSLGHARLAILDPTPDGDQPMWNDSRSAVIVFNGEIYNFRQLIEKEHLTCRTRTDTEVLLKLYERYGMDFLPSLRGMFAFVLFDTRTRTLFAARDGSGIKPLYLTRIGGSLALASEVRALMQGLPQRPAINFASLSAYLRLQYVPGPETLCEGIESMPPGTVLRYTEGKESHWTFQAGADVPTIRSKQEFRERFPAIMQEAVDAHLVSDKPVGVFLSGGMDSSIVLHHMAKASSEPVRTFTVRFEATEAEGAARFNRDADLALLTAKHYGTHHQELLLTAQMERELYFETTRALDLPNADSVSVAQYALARLAKKSVDVVLCGAGGDELFGGYPRYRIARILSMIRHIPVSLRKIGARMTGLPPDVLAMAPGAALAERLLARPVDECRSIVRGDWFTPDTAKDILQNHFDTVESDDPVRRMMEVDRSLWLVDESLRLSDAVTMGSGLESRIPFLDTNIIAWSHATPSSWHVGLKRTKALLKDTYKPILPPHLFSLDKASFYPPLAKWIRRECAPLIEEALHQARIQELFNVEVLRHLHQAHIRHEQYALHPLQAVLQLGNWFESVYDA
ncbi:MAG: asparagine synthase (glutamine-hydrolyzing) [Candidatus Peribacteraceae bacterium]|nr:asparagine synthase (glutamine-hydrolyzing) [Candidatus Peribacteraceae bacterium]